MNIARMTQAIAVATVLGATSFGTTSVMADNSNFGTFDNWSRDTAAQYDGRIPRDVYIDEMGRRWEGTGSREAYLNDLRNRWDRMDTSGRGLTPADVSEITGKVDSNTAGLPKSGSGVQAGNMGPANSKGQ